MSDILLENETVEELENQIEPETLTMLVEFSLRDEEIRKDLQKQGFTRFEPAYTGYLRDTAPLPSLEESSDEWEQRQQMQKEKYFASLTEEDKERISKEKVEYDRVVAYVTEKTTESFSYLRESRYGLKEIFDIILAGKGNELKPEEIIKIMKEKGINVQEFPEQEKGFDGGENHGESRYRNGKWTVKYNEIALKDNREILHELIAIEVFDRIMQENPTFTNSLANLPLRLLASAFQGTSFKESGPRTEYGRKKMLTISILDCFVNEFKSYGPGSPTLQKLRRVLN